ncbi:hypothetical protein [Actinomycetospora aeridis]|uniref:hypothetical protein n=1 Tax=Actinomycetospora aeridis TaxID=3129231 RepID=UPI0035A06047
MSLVGVDPIMDMIRTATNVAGQITVPVLVAGQEGLLAPEGSPQSETLTEAESADPQPAGQK